MTIDAGAGECGHESTCHAVEERLEHNPCPRNLSSCQGAVTRDCFNSPSPENGIKYPADYWFWILIFVIPYGFSCRMDIIETFDAVIFGRTVLDLNSLDNTLWTDPLATFIYVACELLIPVAPFGGFGAGQSRLFWGKRVSRNQVIAKIVTLVTGIEYSYQKVFSHKQTIIKRLLDRYIDDEVEPCLRAYAGVALQRFAGTTRLCDYFGSYIDDTPASPPGKSKGAFLTQVFAVQQLIIDRPDILSPAVNDQDIGHLALHPLLAFFLGINGKNHETTHFASYFECVALPTRIIPNFGQDWWDYYVMTDTERKHEYARLWLHNVRGQDMHDISFYHKAGPPPESDGGPFWGRYTPFTHLHREDCGHPKLYEGSTVFHGRPDASSTARTSTGQTQ